jgi:hypothetical protein
MYPIVHFLGGSYAPLAVVELQEKCWAGQAKAGQKKKPKL